MKTFFKVVGIVLFAIVAMTAVRYGVTAMMGNKPSTGPTTGLILERGSVISGCVKGATEGPNGLTEAMANQYCGCLYDTGISTYGAERFTTDLMKLGKDNIATPEMNAIINKCVGEL